MFRMSTNPVTAAAKICGSIAELARRIGVTKAAVWQWENETKVPFERCIDIERAVGGSVRCEELRPDLADRWAYLRNTTVNAETTPIPKPHHVECCSGDPRHGERRAKEHRISDRREDEAA